MTQRGGTAASRRRHAIRDEGIPPELRAANPAAPARRAASARPGDDAAAPNPGDDATTAAPEAGPEMQLDAAAPGAVSKLPPTGPLPRLDVLRRRKTPCQLCARLMGNWIRGQPFVECLAPKECMFCLPIS